MNNRDFNKNDFKQIDKRTIELLNYKFNDVLQYIEVCQKEINLLHEQVKTLQMQVCELELNGVDNIQVPPSN